MTERTNLDWVSALQVPDQDVALAELRVILTRGLGYALASRSNVTEADIQDFVHDALLKIVAALDSFRGESRFTTWAQKIAVHVALTELRRRRWQDVSLDQLAGFPETDFTPSALSDPNSGPEQLAIQSSLLSSLHRIIDEQLTDRQRQALVAIVIHGMPLPEVARRMQTNNNALYKLLYDARQRVRRRLQEQGLSAEDVLAAFEA
ncbi:MAG: sigma-70 family RNA polymerase sigma factor [Chloroflexi bacterium]|nr:sigma-70 family RNA polymerase sigma factor [Chloroflexota bacterium]